MSVILILPCRYFTSHYGNISKDMELSGCLLIRKALCVHAKQLQSCPTLCDPMDCSPPGSRVHGILRQQYWSELPCPPPGVLPHPGIEPASLLHWQVGSLPLSPIWEAPPRRALVCLYVNMSGLDDEPTLSYGVSITVIPATKIRS